MIKLKDLLTEGVYDPGVLSAVFLAGGPGSGKSFVAMGLFGIPETINIVLSVIFIYVYFNTRNFYCIFLEIQLNNCL